MGLLDQIAGAVEGAVLQAGESGARGALSQAIGHSLDGGVAGLLSQLRAGGLEQQVETWLSQNSQNLPISAEQLQAVLGSEQVRQIAGHLGIDPAKVLEAVAQHLPAIAAAHAA